MKRHQQKSQRPAPFSLRLTEDERAKLEGHAGSMPLASYIKSVVLADEAPKYRKRSKPPVAEQQLLAEILAWLGASRMASNLNQIAKGSNQGTLVVNPDLERDLQQACVDVAWMRVTLLAALGLKR
ncbi:hypothetical protein [Roseobacter sp. GAI101]|uniref:hypothetical protein n=1 Tax=Roseobacter sp. (strain GAI101) TaxID=391589 RepID=UPI00030E3233|nr:hypothetical protein [Roseobacter sp. GAI101]